MAADTPRTWRKPPSRGAPRLGLDGACLDEFLETLLKGELAGVPPPVVCGVEDFHRVFVCWSRQQGDAWPAPINLFVRACLTRGLRRVSINVSIDGGPKRRRRALVFSNPPIGIDSYQWARSGFVKFAIAVREAELNGGSAN